MWWQGSMDADSQNTHTKQMLEIDSTGNSWNRKNNNDNIDIFGEIYKEVM